jgi:hypothetical protein
MARRTSSETGAPDLWDNFLRLLSWFSLRKSAVRFMHTYSHIGIQKARADFHKTCASIRCVLHLLSQTEVSGADYPSPASSRLSENSYATLA